MTTPKSPHSPSSSRSESGPAPPSSLAPEALAGLGKLRECVAAAKNLEHLVASRDVGPKVLGQVVPDVASELQPFSRAVVDVYTFVQGELGLPQDSLADLVTAAQRTSDKLVESLRAQAGGQFNAKRRLAVEREIRESLPPLSATLSQMELLVDATAHTAVTMSVAELLSSSPETGSNRPRRKITVTGSTQDLEVSIPARIGLQCLGMVASALVVEKRPAENLHVEADGAQIRLTFSSPTNAPAESVEIPIYPHSRSSLDAVRVALMRYSGQLLDQGQGLLLPQASEAQ